MNLKSGLTSVTNQVFLVKDVEFFSKIKRLFVLLRNNFHTLVSNYFLILEWGIDHKEM